MQITGKGFDLLHSNKIEGHFDLVLLAIERAKQLIAENTSVDGYHSSKKIHIVALESVINHQVNLHELRKKFINHLHGKDDDFSSEDIIIADDFLDDLDEISDVLANINDDHKTDAE